MPIGRVPELLEGIAAIADRLDVTIATFGHAGDGNMHPTAVYDRRDDAQVRFARVAFLEIVKLAQSLDGTLTGEHGVGALKSDLLPAELGESHDLHRAIKHALDPHALFNPGRAI